MGLFQIENIDCVHQGWEKEFFLLEVGDKIGHCVPAGQFFKEVNHSEGTLILT